ncbi:uncharacterized protein LOC143861467 [Tasmannia lanceolata]|uniref:uncharacterized protein LOC143861467 n=1 Tax=Tasmannia lanceolata TaxID=3420 RepID=UPI0040641FBA
MKKQSTVEKIRQGAQPRAQEGAQQAQQERQKRKATVLGSPAPSQGTPPPSQRPKTKVKLIGPFAQGGGSSKSGGASTGAGSGARPPTGISEHVFRPNWAVLKDDTALGESRVPAELMSKCLLQKDKQQVLYEPPATGEEAVLSSAYQILLYYNDLKEKSKSFSQAITASEEVNGKLAAEVQELQTSIGRIEEERRLLKEDLAAEKRKLAKAAEAMEAQRGRATDRQEKAVKEATEAKEAELFSLSSEAYSLGYYGCLQELQHGSFSTCIISAASLSMLDLCRNSIRMLPRVVYPEAASFDSTSALAFSVRVPLNSTPLTEADLRELPPRH